MERTHVLDDRWGAGDRALIASAVFLNRLNRILALAPQAARLNKQTFRQFYMKNQSVDGTNNAYSAINNIAISDTDTYNYANSAEHREGIQAFIDKRKPIWTTD